jgi:hypothetical protein
MREICAACLEGDATSEELASRARELDAQKENISRLSASIAGTEFMMFQRHGDDALSELRSIDDAIERMSGKISRLEKTSDGSEEERISEWMRELFGD